MNTHHQRLQAFRKILAEQDLQAFIIPGTDPHQSEYIAPHWKGRDWLCGFDGSAGNVVVTADFAGLWTDSRYFIQAEAQLAETGFTLQKLVTPHKAEYIDWLCETLSPGDKVGLDPKMFSITSFGAIEAAFSAKDITLVQAGDLLGPIWEDRPPIPTGQVYEHAPAFAGEDRSEKFQRIREKMQEQGADLHLLTALDDIAWTFNLRGNDVAYNPVGIAYAVMGSQSAHLFINPDKLPDELRALLEKDGVQIHGYESIRSFLGEIEEGSSIWLDEGLTNIALSAALKEGVNVHGDKSIPTRLKAIKNEVELENLRHTMVKDGVALVHFFKWLEDNLAGGNITEVSAGEKLREFRSQQSHFIGESFNTIAGYKGHGAIVHYGATEATDVPLEAEGVFLLDSGGQYLDGTTDITRTIAMGPVPEEAKRDFTLVLKGHIALSRAIYPEGTSGGQLDILARHAMWQEKINYGHGTGHGVGFFLNVHEGPQRIGPGNSGGFAEAMLPGMVTSNEPGIYREGAYGIRTENLVLTVVVEENDFGTFLGFENLTWYPIDVSLIDAALLTAEEKHWLNEYHAEVYRKLSPYLEEDERVWLQSKTQELA